MILTPVFENLYQVTDFLPADLLQGMLQIPWADRPGTSPFIEKPVPLRRVVSNDLDVLDEINCWFKTQARAQIEDTCGIRFQYPDQAFVIAWVDEPGFCSVRHLDGTVPSTLQIYLSDNNMGTDFYQDAAGKHLIKQFASEINTGYFKLYSDSAPPLWHESHGTVPQDCLRVTLYGWLGNYWPVINTNVT